MVRPLVSGTIAAISVLKDTPGSWFNQLDDVVSDLSKKPFRFTPPIVDKKEKFMSKVSI